MSEPAFTRESVMDLLYEKMKAIMERPPDQRPTDNLSMINDLDADSLEVTQIIGETTRQLKVRLNRDEVKGFKTIGDMLDAIMRQIPA